MFHAAGLSDAEDDAYRLIAGDQGRVAQVVAALGAQAIPALDRLRRLSLVTVVDPDADPPEQSTLYAATPPDLAAYLLASHLEHSVWDRLAAAARLRGAAASFAHSMPPTERARGFELHDPGSVLARRAEVARFARVRVVVLDPEPTPDPTGVLRLVGKGVTVRTVVPRRALSVPAVSGALGERQREGEVVRVLPTVPAHIVLADEHSAVVSGNEGGLLLSAGPAFDVVSEFASAAWDRAAALPTPRTKEERQAAQHRGGVLSDNDAELLQLLVAGLQDQAIARRLGIGLRTVVRRIGKLSKLLDAETRFQLGLQASRRGLV